MADTNTIVHIGENSPEQIAYKLLHDIATVEGKVFYKSDDPQNALNRKWILDTYAECVLAIKAPSSRG